MSTSQPDAQKRTDTQPIRHAPLGTDADGNHHVHAAVDDRIYVLDGATITHVEDLTTTDNDWQDWLGYVDDCRGWDHLEPGAAVALLFVED